MIIEDRLCNLMSGFADDLLLMSDEEVIAETRGCESFEGLGAKQIRQQLLAAIREERRRIETSESVVAHRFHALYYDKSRELATWMGVPIFKCPLDLHVYQEILFEVKPDIVLEAGTYLGGSALYLAHLMDVIGRGHVITIDIEERERPRHPRITYLTGPSTDMRRWHEALADYPADAARMVILDSDHSKENVLQEMTLLAPYVSPGSYLIVEDTNINGNPVLPDFGPGPAEAVAEFLKYDSRFIVDRTREKLLVTFNPGGYLKRIER